MSSKKKESSTQRTLHAAVSTRKGTNGELFQEEYRIYHRKACPSKEDQMSAINPVTDTSISQNFKNVNKNVNKKAKSWFQFLNKRNAIFGRNLVWLEGEG